MNRDGVIGGADTFIATGLIKAVIKFTDIFNPDKFVIISWESQSDGLHSTFLLFGPGQSSYTEVTVDNITGEARLNWISERDVMTIRSEVAGKMGVDISEVHVLSFMPSLLPGQVTYPEAFRYPDMAKVRVGKYILDLWLDHYDGYGFVLIVPSDPSIEYSPVRLLGFQDSETGKDYIAEAQNALVELLNPEEVLLSDVISWSFDGTALDLKMHDVGFANIIPFPGYLTRASIPVRVDLSSGLVTIDPAMSALIETVRADAATGLRLELSDIHVNGILAKYDYKKYFVVIELQSGYLIDISTPRFLITYSGDYHYMDYGII
ncbi:MAG: hypothetical protein Q8R48_01485, partial [Candidatus Omnitrophota bacterium]|nr:hypothetical protein [Candidatus Omnitrophota bacterium]